MATHSYRSRLERVEAQAAQRQTRGAILVFRDRADDDRALRTKIAAARQARGLRPDDESVLVIVVTWGRPESRDDDE